MIESFKNSIELASCSHQKFSKLHTAAVVERNLNTNGDKNKEALLDKEIEHLQGLVIASEYDLQYTCKALAMEEHYLAKIKKAEALHNNNLDTLKVWSALSFVGLTTNELSIRFAKISDIVENCKLTQTMCDAAHQAHRDSHK